MKTITKQIYDELKGIISVAQISFIPADKTIQVLTQGKLLSSNRHGDDLTDSEKEAQRRIALWSAEIYGI
ncbi:MAG: hypothetical protein PHW62_00865 [Candidatus Ratteibacteria bacterium]|nr:hypothetical protein [Candidatus Ratteibacteria bacterium]